MKLVTATKRGGSVSVPLTGMIKEGEQYIAQKKGNTITLTPVQDIVKDGAEKA